MRSGLALFLALLAVTAASARAGDARRVRLVETDTGLARQILDGRTVLSSVETPWPAPDEAWAGANRSEILRLVLAGSRKGIPGSFRPSAMTIFEEAPPEPPTVLALPLPQASPERHHLVVVPASFQTDGDTGSPMLLLVLATIGGRPGRLTVPGRLLLRWDEDCALSLHDLAAHFVHLAQGTFLSLGFTVFGGTSGDRSTVSSHWFFEVGADGALAAAGDCVTRFGYTDRYGRFKGRHYGRGAWWFEDLDGDGFQDLVIERTDSMDEVPEGESGTGAYPSVHWVPCLWLRGRFRGAPPNGPGDVVPLFWSRGSVID